MKYNAIPEMTDPLGRHWNQPADIRNAPMDDKTVILTSHQYMALSQYDTTYPSGKYFGKCWVRVNGDTKWLCWYEPCDIPDQIGIGRREIIMVHNDDAVREP